MLFFLSFFLFFFSVTALFYLDNSRKVHLQGVRARGSKDLKRRAPHLGERGKTGWETWGERGGKRERELTHAWGEREREREGESPLAPLFICFFLPAGLSYANWA